MVATTGSSTLSTGTLKAKPYVPSRNTPRNCSSSNGRTTFYRPDEGHMKRIGQVEASQIYAGPAPHIFACERRVQRPQGFRDSLRKLLAKLHTQLIFIMVSASKALSKTTRFSACLQPTAKQPLSSSSPHRMTSDGPITCSEAAWVPAGSISNTTT